MTHRNLQRSLLFSSLLLAVPVQAGGLWVSEFNQPTMGRAAAGEEAGVGDATDALFNPAAMSRHEESQLMVTAGAVFSEVEFDVEQGSALNGTADGGDAGATTPTTSAFWTRPLNDRWTVGMSAAALTGAVLDYDNDWVGRFEATEVSLLVIGLIPAVSYKVTDKLSLGLSMPVMYSDLELDIAVPEAISPTPGEGKLSLDGDDIQVAGTASFLYEFTEKTRLGGRFTSKFDFDYDGDVQTAIDIGVGVNTEITMAAIARIGLAHDIDEQWSIYASVGWDNWSQLGDVFLTTEQREAVLPRNWEDTYHYGVGVDYRMDKRWTLRAGMSHDTNPVDEKDRTADMPIDEQWRFAIGADYLRDSGMTISGSLVYADYGDAEIDNTTMLPAAGFSGEYSSNELWFASLSFNWPMGVSR